MMKATQPPILHCVNERIIPSEPHWVIIHFSTLYIAGKYPDDESESHTMLKYTAFQTKGQWEEEIKRRSVSQVQEDRRFVALFATPAQIEMMVNIKVNMPR